MKKLLLVLAAVPSLTLLSSLPAAAKGPPVTICSDSGSEVTYVIEKGHGAGTYTAPYSDDDGSGAYSSGDTLGVASYAGTATTCA